MLDSAGISESLKRLQSDIDAIHQPRLDAAKAEIDQFFDGAEERVEQFFTFFGQAADMTGSDAENVKNRAQEATDFLSASADRMVATADRAVAAVSDVAPPLDADLKAAAEICVASLSEVSSASNLIETQWAVVVGEATNLLEAAQNAIEQVIAKAESTTQTIGDIDQRYEYQFVEATNSVNTALERTQHLLQELVTANKEHGDELRSRIDEEITAAIDELKTFLLSIVEHFGGFRDATALLSENGNASMETVLDLIQDVERILDVIRPFLDLIDSLN
ncbi:MAG: hypothetical protein GYB33_09680 [Gammaproteobacteria bacterium]|nr:hypothetical protein [Gammaproteobacteria bacterium]